MEQKFLYKFSIYIFFLSLIMLFLVPIVGIEVKGSKRWLDLFFLPRIQPVERKTIFYYSFESDYN